MKINTRTLIGILALLPSLAMAQAPQYHVDYLGTFMPYRISEGGRIIGTATVAGNQRGYSFTVGHPIQYLPLPAGMVSSIALDQNEAGVIVGAVGPYYSTEFQPRAIAWDPDGSGGYTTRYLGALPGQAISQATAVNNLGDIVGYSSDGPYRYPVLFTAPGGILNLSSTGIFDPRDINDHRVLVDGSFTAKKLDLNSMAVEDLGVPVGSYLATSAATINEAGQVGGLAILNTSGDANRVAARYSNGAGWEVFSSNGVSNSVSDMNEQGDVVMVVGTACYVRFDGLGTYLLEDQIQNTVGHWYPSYFSGLTMNSAGQIAVFATNQVTGQSGTVLLTPVTAMAVADPGPHSSAAELLLTCGPNPCAGRTEVRYELRATSRIGLRVFDGAGRVVRVLAAGEEQGPGSHSISWDGRDDLGRAVPSGTYLLALEDGGRRRVGRVTLLR